MKKPFTIPQQERIKRNVVRQLLAAGFVQQDNFLWIQMNPNMRLCIRGPFEARKDEQGWTVQSWDTQAQDYPSIGMSGSTSIGSMWANKSNVFGLLFSKAYEVGYQLGRTTERSHTKVAIQPLLMILNKLV